MRLDWAAVRGSCAHAARLKVSGRALSPDRVTQQLETRPQRCNTSTIPSFLCPYMYKAV